MKESTILTERVEYFDSLRIIATFAVILIHVSAWFDLHNPPVGVDGYLLCGDLVRWSVPIFVMISGALLLNTKRTIKQIYSKNVLRIVTAFLFWSIIYAFVNNGGNAIGFSIFGTILDGPGHLWFLYMIVGLYMIIPILYKMVESDKITCYFLLLSLLFVFLIPFFGFIVFYGNRKRSVDYFLKNRYFKSILPLGYSGYFVLGYYLRKHVIQKKAEIVLYTIAFLGIALTVFSAIFQNGDSIINRIVKLDYLSPIVLIESTALFVLCKNHFQLAREKARKLLSNISKCTFGIYLVHILVMNFFFDIVGITDVLGNSLASVLLISVITFLLSLVISEILNRIPFINKYIV